MFTASRATTWLPLYLVLIILLMIAYGPKKESKMKTSGEVPPLRAWATFLLTFLAIAASAGLADLVTSGILKPLIARPRPSHSELEPILHFVNGYHGGHYGFPSSHAADTTAVALSFCMLYGKRWGWPAIWIGMGAYVVINCYSRMYLGVHYPSDILVGAAIGALIAWCLSSLVLRFLQSQSYFIKKE